MSVAHATPVLCPACRAPQRVSLPESVNVERDAGWRDQVLGGTFMRIACDQCGSQSIVERELTYSDVSAGLFVGVFPRARKADFQECARVVEEAFRAAVDEAPAAVRDELAGVRVRVCFGYAQLREKVVCATLGLDDRIVEAMKLALFDAVYVGSPGPELPSVDELYLIGVDEIDGALVLMRHFDRPMTERDKLLRVDRAMYDSLTRDRDRLALLLAPIFSTAYVHAAHPALQS